MDCWNISMNAFFSSVSEYRNTFDIIFWQLQLKISIIELGYWVSQWFTLSNRAAIDWILLYQKKNEITRKTSSHFR